MGKARISGSRVKHKKYASLVYALAILQTIRLGWKRLARDNHSRFLGNFISYRQENVFNFSPRLASVRNIRGSST
jgi:hypothetical protein